jgi:hypothetical protein
MGIIVETNGTVSTFDVRILISRITISWGGRRRMEGQRTERYNSFNVDETWGLECRTLSLPF